MSGSVNRVLLIGNVAADPEVRRTQDGKPVVNLRLATNESWKDKATGEKKERTEYHRIVIFSEGLCRVVEAYVRKGSKLYIEGQLQTRKWKDQNGADKYSTEIVLQGFSASLVLLDSKGSWDGAADAGDSDQEQEPTRPKSKGKPYEPKLLDDSIPF